MKIITALIFSASVAFAQSGAANPIVPAPPAAEIERLNLDPFYEKYLAFDGFPIVGSKQVHDEAFLEAAYLINKMIGHRPEIIEAMRKAKVRFAIMAPGEYTTDIPEHSTLTPKAYWDKRARGLGATKARPAVSVGEENLLGFRGDPYSTESIFVHEFAHAIHHIGINEIDPTFQGKLETAFNRASLKGLWKGKYAGTNPAEYWAEGVQSWFGTNREDDHDHNHVNTRAELRDHDPGLAALVESIFGDGDWRYLAPASRYGTGHLHSFSVADAPVFSWPDAMVKAYAAIEAGEGLELVEINSDITALPDKSGASSNAVSFRFDNETEQRITVSWLNFSGEPAQPFTIDPGRNHKHQTYESHVWIFTDESGKTFGWLATPAKDGRVVIE